MIQVQSVKLRIIQCTCKRVEPQVHINLVTILPLYKLRPSALVILRCVYVYIYLSPLAL